ncbi:MAG: FtsX-like permease family protein [Candidatus Heimdallarchaeota archaeon]|nr:FtsX-like permease family protein [Candidatus Heimdallarchaeota archaeon]MCK4770800.1 FtsX-like permease family protein [Candidatus Heimdallarchaeota archaeon]
MKISSFFSFIGFSFKSMFSNKRRSISIGAGMVLGAAIFSSIFFYGSIINSITVQDMIENVEFEVTFRPYDEPIEQSPQELAGLVKLEEEFEECIVTYGNNYYRNLERHAIWFSSYMTPSVNYSEYSGIQVSQPYFSPIIVGEEYIDSVIGDRINLVAGEVDLQNDGILLSIEKYRDLGIQINETLPFTFGVNRTEFSEIDFDETNLISFELNLTVRGFYRSGLMINDDDMLISSHNFNESIIDNLTEYKMFQLPTKLNLDEFPLNDIQGFNEAIDVTLVRIEQKFPLEGSNLISGALWSYQGVIIFMQLIDTVMYIPAIVLSIILINLGAELALQERKFEISVLKAQGASPKQIRRMILSEVFIIAIIGEIIGIFLGILGAAMVLSTYRFMAIDFPSLANALTHLNIKPWSIITTVVVTFGILFITTIKKTNAFIRQEVATAKTMEKEKKGWFKRIYGDVIFFMLGLVGVLLTVIADVNPDVRFSFVVDLLQTVTPLLLWYGSAGVVSRLSTKVPEKLDKILVKLFKDIGSLLKGSLSRRHQNFPRMTVLLCLSVSLCIFAAIQGETSAAEIPRLADTLIGGDMKIDVLGTFDDLSPSDFTGYEEKIDTVTPIYYTMFQSGPRWIGCFGVDLQEYGNEALWHRDSIESYPNWKEGLEVIRDNPTQNVGVGISTARSLEIDINPSFNFTIYNGTKYTANAAIIVDHAPGILMDFGGFSFSDFDGGADYFMLVDKQFIDSYAPFTNVLVRAIINLKPGVDPIEENLSFKLNSEFDWIVDAKSYEEEIEETRAREGLSFGFPGLLTINFIIAMVGIVIGVSIFMFMIINQRKKEFAILIAEGASRTQLIKLVLTEVISMAVFATLFGAFIGFLLGYQFNDFFGIFSVTTFNRLLVFPPIPLIATVLGAFGIVILSTLIPASIAARTNVVEEMRTV